MPLLHRHYKIARTETRCHLLLKIRQMATQTSASRDYVLFSSGKSATRKFLNCLMICGHSPWSAPNLERHGSSRMQTFCWLEMPHFLNRIFTCISTWNPQVCFFHADSNIRVRVSYHALTLYAGVSAQQRQWADFSAALCTPLYRFNKRNCRNKHIVLCFDK